MHNTFSDDGAQEQNGRLLDVQAPTLVSAEASVTATPLTPTDVRMRLRQAGYSPIPTRGKNPGIAPKWSWEKLFNSSNEQIALWIVSVPDARNTGILTRDNPCLDVDVSHPEAAAAIEDMVRAWVDELDGTILVRFGRAPRRAIPFKTSVPFKKLSTTLQAPDGTEQKVEFLADGQQIIVHGIHPDIRKPYKWHGCNLLSDVEHDELPAITGDEAAQLVNDIVKKLVDDFGFVVKARASKKRTKRKQNEAAQRPSPVAETFWDKVNKAALEKLGAWVPKLFKDAVFYEGTGAFRVTSKMLKRDLQEDLSFSPLGIIDWGIDDQDEDGGGLTAIDAVIEWSVFAGLSAGVPLNTKAAAHWLCSCMGVEPESLGWKVDAQPQQGGYRIEDFYSYLPSHQYIFVPTRQLWPGGSVDAKVPSELKEVVDEKTGEMKIKCVLATNLLDRARAVAQLTWAPGMPELIKDKVIAEGGWFDRPGVDVFNQYISPFIDPAGDPEKAGPWIEHVRKVYGEYADHIRLWLAQRTQKPQDKINHSLVLGGEPGIGKDSLLEPAKHAVGPWNCGEASPIQLLGRFNSFAKSVILRISESRDLGEVDRYALHDHLKVYQASPPDVLRIDEKHVREYYIPNVTGVVITTNHRTDCLYLPADDRRHYVAWSELTRDSFEDGYWNKLWGWYASGGIAHVCAYLRTLDISGFDPKAPPQKTPAFWAIVDAGRPSEESELTDILDRIGPIHHSDVSHTAYLVSGQVNPPTVVTISQIVDEARRVQSTLADWLEDRKNRKVISHRLEKAGAGYLQVRNPDVAEGTWKVDGRRQMVYGRKDKTERERLDAAKEMVRKYESKF